MKKTKLLTFFLVFIYYLQSNCQEITPYYTNNTYQNYINYLQNSNKLILSHPLSQPYNTQELYDSLITIKDPSDKLLNLVKKDLLRYIKINNDSANYKGNLKIGIDLGNSDNYVSKNNTNDFKGEAFIYYSYKNIGFYNSLDIDEAYKRDTVYFGTIGKLENKNFSRFDESYLQWGNKNYTIFTGRINRNFGLYGENSLVLSPNSFSFDQLTFTFHNKYLKYTALFARLNDIYSFDIRDSIPVYMWDKRFVTMHRFEVALTKKIELAFTDVMLFGGKDAFPQLQYINPVNFLYISKLTDRNGFEEGNANALICFDTYYKPITKITLFGQFLVDDMDFTKSLRAIYPDRIGYSIVFIYSDILPLSQIKLSLNKVSNWTYNEFYTWGNYTFYGKSLGYPENGVENIKLTFDYFKYYPFMIQAQLMVEENRLQDLNAPYIALKTDFPIGIPEKYFSASLNTSYIPNTFMSASFTAEFITFDNYNYVRLQKQSFFNFFVTLKLNGIFSLI